MGLCGEALPAKLDAGLRARLRAVIGRLDAAAAASGKKRVRLLKKARGPLGAVGRKTRAAAKSKRSQRRISPACAGAIDGLVDEVGAALS
jgi:hypothetical protein